MSQSFYDKRGKKKRVFAAFGRHLAPANDGVETMAPICESKLRQGHLIKSLLVHTHPLFHLFLLPGALPSQSDLACDEKERPSFSIYQMDANGQTGSLLYSYSSSVFSSREHYPITIKEIIAPASFDLGRKKT